jgi:hypothetical protein
VPEQGTSALLYTGHMDELAFKSPSWWKSEWTLSRREQHIGSLKITSKWSWTLAEVQIGEKRYELGYHGWVYRFFIRDGSGQQIAESKPRSFWSSASDIELAGRRYVLSYNWNGSHTAVDGSGAEVVRVKPSYWKCASTVSLRNPENESELLLAFLLFYRMKVVEATSAAAA